MTENRYALLTVDTEALPKRASEKHVERLMWGKHEKGTAGIAEMCAIGDMHGVKHTFFVDLCATYTCLDEVRNVVQWLDGAGQDVQLHTHPEYLPQDFRKKHKLHQGMRVMNTYSAEKNLCVIKFFSELMTSMTQKPVRAFRAGSFRWNADTLKALKECSIPLSFNNSTRAMQNEQCVYSIAQNTPFLWSNGVYEIPMTEQNRFLQPQKWDRLQYYPATFLHVPPKWLSFLPYTLSKAQTFVVALLHSWSFLYWDKNSFATYKNEKRMENYHVFLKRLSKDYDIITTVELLDLLESGKISPTHTEDICRATYVAPKR